MSFEWIEHSLDGDSADLFSSASEGSNVATISIPIVIGFLVIIGVATILAKKYCKKYVKLVERKPVEATKPTPPVV